MANRTPRRAVELEVERWRVDEIGFTQPPYIARFELVWPRPGIDSVKSALPLPNRFGETVDWSEADLLRKWLFKEDMEGRMILTVSVLPIQSEESPEALPDEALDLVGRSIARSTSIAHRTLSDLLEIGGSVANFILAGPQKTVAKGHVVVEKQEDQLLEIPLVAPNTLENPEPDPTPEDHRNQDDHEDILKEEGESNGFVEVEMSVWEE